MAGPSDRSDAFPGEQEAGGVQPGEPGGASLRSGDEVGDGRYEILEVVGHGGMGDVYKARDRHLDRVVAVKTIRPHPGSDTDTAKRLVREARLAASLDHPFICKIHELLQETDGRTLLVMEYVDGPALSSTIENGPVPPARVVRYAREIAEALSVAHERGLVHRDIKPSNVMLTAHGHVKVMDFGIAKTAARPEAPTTSTLTGPGHVVGTPAYMSPEQAAGRAVDHRSDVYSFGVLLYECLTGAPPFDPGAQSALLRWLPLARPGALPRHVPGDLRGLIRRCLERRPDARYQSFADIRAALDSPTLSRLTAGSTNALVPVDPWNWRLWAWLAALTVAVAAGALGLDRWWAGRHAPGSLKVQRPVVTWPTTELGSHVSPDGAAVAFLSTQGGLSRLWVGSVDGREPAPIAGPRDAMKTPVWSPDGRRIAYLIRDDGQAWVQIATVWGETDGPAKPLGRAWDDVALVRWIGTHLYFSVASGSTASILWLFDTAAGATTQVTHPSGGMRFTTSGSTVNVDVRQDEQRIVFLSASREGPPLWVADLDGRNGKPIPLEAGLMSAPRWRGPDGRHIVFVSNENGQSDIWDYDVRARSRSPLTTSPLAEDSVDVSAAGDVIVADTAEQVSHLWAMRPGTADAPRQLTNDRSDIWPSAAADSERVIFHRRKGSFVDDAPTDTDLLTARWADGRLAVGADLGAGAIGRISPDGRRVYFLRWASGPADRDRPPELWLQELDAVGAPVRLSETFWYPGTHIATWTATGQTAAWGPGGSGDLFFVRPSAGSPDTFELVRAAIDPALRATTRVLATTPADRGRDERVSDLAVAGDGRTLVFLATSRRPYRGGRLMRLDLERPADAPRLLFEAAADTQVTVAGWTPRGTVVVLVSSRPDQGDVTQVLEIDGGGRAGARRVASQPGLIGVTAQLDPAGDRLFATAMDGGVATVCALSLAGGERTTVVTNVLDGIAFGGYTVMRDGWLLYTRKETNFNVWLLDFRTGPVSRAAEGGR